MAKKPKLLVLPSVKNTDEVVSGISKAIDFTATNFGRIDFRFKDNSIKVTHKGVDLREYPFVWLSSFWGSRDLAYAVRLYLDHFGTPHTPVEKSTSKLTDQIFMVLNNIPTPNTYFIARSNITRYVESIESVCGYPLIIKETKGSRGKYSAYVRNRKELFKKRSELPNHRKYLFQKFIPNEYDWGVLVADGEVVAAEKSYPKNGEFRNNACNGAKEVFVEVDDIPKSVQDMAIRASEVLGLSWSRSDILIDKSTNIPYMLEVNRCPGVTSGTAEVRGAQKFIKSRLNLLR